MDIWQGPKYLSDIFWDLSRFNTRTYYEKQKINYFQKKKNGRSQVDN